MTKKLNQVIFCISLLLLGACGSSTQYAGPTPVDLLIRDNMEQPSFSIVLYDMQLDENQNQYQHKYRVKLDIEDSTKPAKVTEWKDVDEAFFAENLDNMGLELASKSTDGTIHKIPAPPGFNEAVGNPKYGQWRSDNNGNSFWAFYGQYAFMSAMFNMATRPVYRSTYRDYSNHRSNPSTRNRAYYGTSTSKFGTSSSRTRASNPSFYQRAQQQSKLTSFRQKVRSNPSRYSRRSSRSRSRSSGRYSTSRGRSSGFGK